MGLKINFKYFCNSHFEKVENIVFSNGELNYFSLRSLKHEVNEDSFGYLEIDGELKFFFVADGMGGHAGGAKASELICQNLEKEILNLKKYDDQSFRNLILDLIEHTNEQINDLKIGAGTTFCAIQITQNGARFYNCGDSMAMLIGSRGKIKHKVLEHSPLGFAIESGILTRNQKSIESSIVSNGLGFNPMWIEQSQNIQTSENDLLGIFSDAFLNHFDISQMSETLSSDLYSNRLTNLHSQFSSQLSREKYLTDDSTILLFKLGVPSQVSQ